jgi:hypothetical protein
MQENPLTGGEIHIYKYTSNSEKHLEKSNDLSSKVDVEVCFYPHLGSAQTTCAFS